MKNTIIKLLVIISALLLLAFVVVWMPEGSYGDGKKEMTQLRIDSSLSVPLFKYRMDTGDYPTSEEGLDALLKKNKNENWNGPYVVDEESIRDEWGRKFEYSYPGENNKGSYDLYSLGEDGIPSEDDIKNWN